MSAIKVLVKIIIACTLLGALVCALLYWGHSELNNWSNRPQTLSKPITIEFKRGTPLSTLSKQLESAGLVEHQLLFEWWVRLFSKYREYQAGPYRFEDEISPQLIDRMIRRGEIFQPIVLEITFPEGFTADQIFERAANKGIGSKEELWAIAETKELWEKFPRLPNREELDKLELKAIEGYLFPATYRFTAIPTPQALVELLVSTFFERLPEDYEEKLAEFDFSLHDAVKMASLIERETRNDDERSIVSEVIHNRLNEGVALAIDASIIYGIPNFDGNLRRRHLNDSSNIFNTRKIRGLPPGPISSPGEASLRAVVSPTDHGYWYYVVDAENFSKHRFSRTLKEHNRNVSEFWRAKKGQ